MELTIKSTRTDCRDADLITRAVPFMLNGLLTSSQREGLIVNVVITTLNGDHGDVVLNEAPSFQIRLSSQCDTIMLVKTLAHELVHLSQVVNGRLKFRKINGLQCWVWDGKSYGPYPYRDPDRTLPWESDAERHEDTLCVNFVKHHVKFLNGS
jgi:hypothetical protein